MEFKFIARIGTVGAIGVNRKAIAICMALFVNRLGAMTKMFFPIYLVGEHNLTVSQAAGIMSFYGGGLLVGALILGYLADKSPKGFAIVAFIGSAATLSLLAIVKNQTTLAIILASAGMFDSGANVLGQRLLLETTDEHERLPAQALVRVGNNLGAAVAGVLCGLLAAYKFNLVFLFDAACSLGAAAIIYKTFSGIKKTKAYGKTPSAGGKSPFRDIQFLIFEIGVIFIATAYHALYFGLGTQVLTAYSGSTASFGIQFTINAAIVVLLQIPISRKLAHVSGNTIVITGTMLLIAGFFLLYNGTTFILLVVSTITWTIGEIILFPFINVRIMKRAGSQNSGMYFGVAAAAWNSAAVTTPLCIAAITAAQGFENIWIFCMMAIFTGACLILIGSHAIQATQHLQDRKS